MFHTNHIEVTLSIPNGIEQASSTSRSSSTYVMHQCGAHSLLVYHIQYRQDNNIIMHGIASKEGRKRQRKNKTGQNEEKQNLRNEILM